MKKKKVAYNTYLLTFDNQKELCKTMLRFQEHYESPKFTGRIFSLSEFKKWYSNNGLFTYYSDWNGFNIPGNILKPFYNGEFKNITKREQMVLDMFAKHNENFYIIAIHKEEPHSYTHEMLHAMFYHYPDYQKKIKNIIYKYRNNNYVKALCKYLKEIGYSKDVLYDEINAYVATGENIIESDVVAPSKFTEELVKLADIYTKVFITN